MAGTYWLTILPDTKNLKPGIQAALAGTEFKPKITVDKAAAKKAGEDAAKTAEDAANKRNPKIKPEADKPAARKAGEDAAEESRKPVENKRPKVKPQPDLPGSRKAGEDAGAAVGGGLMSSLKMLGPMLGGAAIFGGLKSAISDGMNFTENLNVMKGVTSATGEQMEQVSNLAKQLGVDVGLTGINANDAASAMTELAKGGMSVDESMKAVRGSLALASAAGLEAGQAAEIQSDALHTFGIQATEAGHVADLLVNAANASSSEVPQMAQALAQAGSAAAGFKIPIEDTLTSLAMFSNFGIKGSDAGTLMKTSLLAITDGGKPATQAINDLGLKLYDAQGQFVGYPEMLNQVATASKNMTEEQFQASTAVLFGSDAMRGAMIAANGGAEAFNRTSEAVRNGAGAAGMAAARNEGLVGAWGNFTNAIDGVKMSIYDMVKGPLESLLNKLSTIPAFIERNSGAFKIAAGVITTLLVPAFILWIKQQTIAMALSAKAGIATLIGSWRMLAGTIINAAAAAGTYAIAIARGVAASIVSGLTTMVSAFRNLSIGARLAAAAQWALNVAMSANPIGIIIAAVVAVGVALWAFFTKTETGRQMWEKIWSAIKTAAGAVFDFLKAALQVVGDKISWLWNEIAVPAFEGIKGAIETMWNGAKVVWDTFTSVLDTVGQKVGAFKDTLTNAFNAVKDVVSAVWDKIGGILDKIGAGIQRIKDAGGAVLNAIGLGGNAAGGVVNGPGYAAGGHIFGPGTGTSDSILGYPAMVGVSNGEYVINAAATAKYLPLLNALNSGALPGFAGGGQVQLGNISGPGITTGEQQSMWDAIRNKFPDAILSSATRTVQTEGHPDFHNAGRAIDISGPGMGAIASWIASNYPDSLELIHSPFGHNIKNGKNVGDGNSFYGAGLMAAHGDHVHWALGKTANSSAGNSASAESDSGGAYSSSGDSMSYRPATSSELSASSNRVSSAGTAVKNAQQSVDDGTFRRDQAQKRLDAATAAGKDTTSPQRSLDVANRELADANERLSKARDKAAEVEAADAELRDKGKLTKDASTVSSSTSSSSGVSQKSGPNTGDLGKMFVGGVLESIGLDGSLFSNPLEWPSVKSLLAGVNFAGGLLSIAGAKPEGAAGGAGGTSGGFFGGAADSVGLGGLMSAIPRPSDFMSGSPSLAPGEFNPGVVGGKAGSSAGSASTFAPHQGSGAQPGKVDNSINMWGNVGSDPQQVRMQMRNEQNARTRSTVVH